MKASAGLGAWPVASSAALSRRNSSCAYIFLREEKFVKHGPLYALSTEFRNSDRDTGVGGMGISIESLEARAQSVRRAAWAATRV